MPIRRSAAYGATCRAHGKSGEPDLIVAPFDGIADLHARPPEPLVREAATARGRTPNRATGHATAATSPETQAYADRRSSSAQIGETERRRGRPTSPAACRRTRRVGGIKMPPSGAARRPLRFLPRRGGAGSPPSRPRRGRNEPAGRAPPGWSTGGPSPPAWWESG